jgi:uncharacterized protein YegL
MSERNGQEAGFDAPDIDAALEASGAQRTPCVLVLDTSSSMKSQGRIEKLNAALQMFERTLKSDEMLCQQALLMVIGFGGEVSLLCDWTQADAFAAPALQASGRTPMGQAMRMAHAAVEELGAKLQANGIAYTRPWIFLMSDGGPNDDGWREAAAESRRACEDKRVVVWPLAVPPGADAAALKAFAGQGMNVYSIGEDANFEAIFEWLGNTLVKLVQSRPGQKLQLTAPSEIVIEA